jgi:hypothetical protein
MRRALTARELDHEAHDRRERLASTLDELSASLTPGRILDEVLSYAKGGGGNFLMGLGKSAASNPLPTLLISTGCALFLSGKGGIPFGSATKGVSERSSRTEYARSVRGRAPDDPGVMSRAVDAVSGAASTVTETLGSAASRVASVASDLGSRVSETAKGAANTVAGAASEAGETLVGAGGDVRNYTEDVVGSTRQSATAAQRRATLLGRELNGKAADAFNEYPLVVAAGGLLVGAALAAFLPRTKIEDRYMGDTSDALKGAFSEGAADTIDRVAAGVGNVVDAVTTKAGEEDILGSAKNSVDELTAKVSNTLKAGKAAIDDELAGGASRHESNKTHNQGANKG